MTDWPLAVCDVQTVDMDRDYIATDVVDRNGFTENYQVYFNPKHKWYYLNKQLPSEVVIFRQTDTDKRFATGTSWLTYHERRFYLIANFKRSKWPSKLHGS